MCASKTVWAVLALVAATLLAGQVAAAEKKSDPARELARRLQLANRKLEQDKAQLAREKAEAEAKLKEVEDKLGAAQGKAAGADRRVAQLTNELDALRTEKEALAGKLDESEKRLAETAGLLRKESDERRRLDTLVAQQKQSLGQCESLNAKLHAEGVALLDKYRNKGCFDAALQGEPFTRLKQVEVENFVEDSRDRIDDLRFETQARR